ncbi:hypothetical protein NPIL_251541 [Nephila pilipes]|uniref:Uncharacterized protein n=1 Tax=Nephila pilipes TaxID=299642 RepID=A0A8X6U295_NEPPI|nr:hypothetical protein NPIL_251541 [Nephila pilipes]
MSQRRYSTDSEAWRIVGWLEEEGGGPPQAEVEKATGVAQSVIFKIWNRFLETRSAGQRPGQGGRVQQRSMKIFNTNGSEIPKYEDHSSSATPSLGYWHHNFDSICPKPAPHCRTVCSPTNAILHEKPVCLRETQCVSEIFYKDKSLNMLDWNYPNKGLSHFLENKAM